jgi:tRNA(adenine34) deaminase
MTHEFNPHEKYMTRALELSQQALSIDEVPIGAVIVQDNQIISEGFNEREKNHCATSHAEILAIENACKKLKSWRLSNCDLYVTLEPCLMCAGALVQARILNV